MRVTVITPTSNRPAYLEKCVEMFKAQDYPQKDMVISIDAADENVGYDIRSSSGIWVVKDWGKKASIGEKRNTAIRVASGQIILHMDDDDHYAPDWISRSVDALLSSKAEIVGLSQLNFYNEQESKGYRYNYPAYQTPWLAGATMCYYKSLWERNKFKDIQIGEDAHFIWGASPVPNVQAHDYIGGFCASIHSGNTSKKMVEASEYRRCTEEEETAIRNRFFLR